jgi:uncharacterized YigZ family protein
MSSVDEYKTIKDFQRCSFLEKGSKFIATAYPINSEKEAKRKIEEISKEFYNADHNCYAYTIGWDREKITKKSDAGEPQGTAGRPILLAIESQNLTNVLVVVTRYFGGTKLGRPGLFKAYQRSALEVLTNCEIVKKILSEAIFIQFPLSFVGKIKKILSQLGVTEQKSKYSDKVILEIEVPKSKVENLKEKLTDVTSGEIKYLDRI